MGFPAMMYLNLLS